MLIVFAGNGKGKTTAALGCAMRALGYGKRVLMIQFIKNGISGEQKFIEKLKIENLKIISTGLGFVGIPGGKISFSAHRKAARDALRLVGKQIHPPAGGKKWDLVILDEINVAVNLKLIKAVDVIKILKSAPKDTDIILTGRNAPRILIQKADLVTEMKEIKHPFQKGQPAKRGIDF